MSIQNIVSSSEYRKSTLLSQVFLDIPGVKNQQNLDPHGLGFLYHAQMEIKDWIKAARTHAQLTQDQLSERLGLTKGNISAWENGRHEASFSQLQQIATLTGYPLANGAAEQNIAAQSEQTILAELSAIAEITAIFSKSTPEQRKRILTAVRDLDRAGNIGRAVANHKS